MRAAGRARAALGTALSHPHPLGRRAQAGLFVYDVFWVFGTDVMVTVAKSFDAPIKLLFVRKFATEEAKAEHSLLGLGDIVIPGAQPLLSAHPPAAPPSLTGRAPGAGIFIALLLRFDAAQSGQRVQPDKRVEAGAVKPRFFTSNLVAYCVGLGATLAAMLLFESAQVRWEWPRQTCPRPRPRAQAPSRRPPSLPSSTSSPPAWGPRSRTPWRRAS